MSLGDEFSPQHRELLSLTRLANANWIQQEYGHRMRFIVSVQFTNGADGPINLGIFDAMEDVYITVEELLEHLPVEQRKLDLGC